MNGDFHFYGTGTAAMAAGLSPKEAAIVANASEFVDYFVGDNYWSYWEIVPDDSWWPKYLFQIDFPQLTAQASFAAGLGYYHDYWLAFHFPPGNKSPLRKQFTGEMAKLQERYLQKFLLREVNSEVKNKLQLCRPYSQFVIDMVYDTIKTYQAIKTDPKWKEYIKNSISHERYVSDSISRDTLALIFLGIRMHVLADTWAHQDFTGFDDKNINRINGDVLADVNVKGQLEKAPYSAVSGAAAGFFTGAVTGGIVGGITGAIQNIDTDIVFAPKSSAGHGNFGHYPDYGWLNIEYPASWRVGSNKIHRDNPTQFKEAWNELASVIAICLNKSGEVDMPSNVKNDLTKLFKLSSSKISAPLECEKNWANNSAKNIKGTKRWKDITDTKEIGVTHGLARTRFGKLWVKDGSILHMYELAALLHFSWCERWTNRHPEFGWLPSPSIMLIIKPDYFRSGIIDSETSNTIHIAMKTYGIINSDNKVDLPSLKYALDTVGLKFLPTPLKEDQADQVLMQLNELVQFNDK
jgi:hypothetical protein